jgi:hypothetical protein
MPVKVNGGLLFVAKECKRMGDIGERFYTPAEIADQGIMSLVAQWQRRKSGELKYIKIGKKVLYSQRHLDEFLAKCEKNAGKDAAEA